MKITVTYELPDDEAAYNDMCLSRENAEAVADLRRELRSALKHGDLTESERVRLEELRALLPHERD